jgi:demethylmenaquinone methyltransferase/2-methoxy-6-polyprenyl-1,4-benzoquinol methylase
MLFELMAPFYDKFMHKVGLDHSGDIPEWLEPLEGREVLDLAGGTGINAVGLAAAGAKVTLADSSRAMLHRAALKGVPALMVQADAANLPFSDDSFDLVLVSDAWHHFRNQDAVASETARVLRRGGRFYIIDFDPTRFQTKLIAFVERLFAEPVTFTRPEALVERLRHFGIVGSCRFLDNYQYLYEGVKK